MTLQVNDKGELDAIAFPGGYSIRYLCNDGDVVCADCANDWLDEGTRSLDGWDGLEPETAFIDWEGQTRQCAHCQKDMPTEYGDPDDEN